MPNPRIPYPTPFDGVSGGTATAQSQAVVLRQVSSRQGNAALGKIRRCSADDKVERRHLTHHHGAVASVAGPNAYVLTSHNHIAHRIVKAQLQFDAWIQTAERRNERQDVGASKRR